MVYIAIIGIVLLLFLWWVGALNLLFKILYQNPKDNRTIGSLSKDQLFLYNFGFKKVNPNYSKYNDYESSEKDISVNVSDVLSDFNNYKNCFIKEVLTGTRYSGDVTVVEYFTTTDLEKLIKLTSLCNSLFILDYISESDKIYVENVFYNTLFSSLKDLYVFTKSLKEDFQLIHKSQQLFKDTKKEYLMTFCTDQIEVLNLIKNRNMNKIFNSSFKDFDLNMGKFTKVLDLISKIEGSKECIENLEMKVVAKNFRTETLPKLTLYEKSPNKNSESNLLVDSILNKITCILEEKSEVVNSDKEGLHMELKIINRYVDSINL